MKKYSDQLKSPNMLIFIKFRILPDFELNFKKNRQIVWLQDFQTFDSSGREGVPALETIVVHGPKKKDMSQPKCLLFLILSEI